METEVLDGTSSHYGIYAAGTSPGLELKNNNISITAGGGGAKYGFYYVNLNSFSDAQKNNFHVQSSQPGNKYYGRIGTVNYMDALTFWQSYPASEVGSPSVDPEFTLSEFGDLSVQALDLIENGEDLLSFVSHDINGFVRGLPPTIGAFETSSGILDAAADTLLVNGSILCEGEKEVRVVIRNNGTEDISSLKINWEIDGSPQPVVNYTQTLFTQGSGNPHLDTVLLGAAPFGLNAPMNLKVWVSDPNGLIDEDPQNDLFEGDYLAINPRPSSGGIQIESSQNPYFTLKIVNPQNVDSFFWYFGDGDSAFLDNNLDISKMYSNAGTYTVMVILRNQCGDDTLTSSLSSYPLPVELGLLSGRLTDKNQALLEWVTYSERNNVGFEVTRSRDGRAFEVVGFVESKWENGDGREAMQYSFLDTEELSSSTFYRLVQLDQDGRKAFSNIVALHPRTTPSLVISALPNPVGQSVTITVHGDRTGQARLTITDLNGKEIESILVTQPETVLDTQHWPQGLFLLSYTDERTSIQMKLVKK